MATKDPDDANNPQPRRNTRRLGLSRKIAERKIDKYFVEEKEDKNQLPTRSPARSRRSKAATVSASASVQDKKVEDDDETQFIPLSEEESDEKPVKKLPVNIPIGAKAKHLFSPIRFAKLDSDTTSASDDPSSNSPREKLISDTVRGFIAEDTSETEDESIIQKKIPTRAKRKKKQDIDEGNVVNTDKGVDDEELPDEKGDKISTSEQPDDTLGLASSPDLFASQENKVESEDVNLEEQDVSEKVEPEQVEPSSPVDADGEVSNGPFDVFYATSKAAGKKKTTTLQSIITDSSQDMSPNDLTSKPQEDEHRPLSHSQALSTPSNISTLVNKYKIDARSGIYKNRLRLFAPPGGDTAKYARKIVQYFNQYHNRVCKAQRSLPQVLPKPPPVVVGRCATGSIDAYVRGIKKCTLDFDFDEAVETAPPTRPVRSRIKPSRICDTNDDDDFENMFDFPPKRVKRQTVMEPESKTSVSSTKPIIETDPLPDLFSNSDLKPMRRTIRVRKTPNQGLVQSKISLKRTVEMEEATGICFLTDDEDSNDKLPPVPPKGESVKRTTDETKAPQYRPVELDISEDEINVDVSKSNPGKLDSDILEVDKDKTSESADNIKLFEDVEMDDRPQGTGPRGKGRASRTGGTKRRHVAKTSPSPQKKQCIEAENEPQWLRKRAGVNRPKTLFEAESKADKALDSDESDVLSAVKKNYAKYSVRKKGKLKVSQAGDGNISAEDHIEETSSDNEMLHTSKAGGSSKGNEDNARQRRFAGRESKMGKKNLPEKEMRQGEEAEQGPEEEAAKQEPEEERITCPMCNRPFALAIIEEHAANCEGAVADPDSQPNRRPTIEEVLPNAQRAGPAETHNRERAADPEPAEEQGTCPMCNGLFALSVLPNHADMCVESKQEEVTNRRRVTRRQPDAQAYDPRETATHPTRAPTRRRAAVPRTENDVIDLAD